MKFGIIPTEGGVFFDEFLEEGERAESLGFDSVWREEHHGIRNHYWPSPLIALTALAARTQRIMLGTDIVVLPFYHPVRLAEDSAMLQNLSKGRFILGAAIGYNPAEFALYQVPMENRGARFEESICLIRALCCEELVTFTGKYFQVKELKIEPLPEQYLPIWLGGWGELSLKRAARLADAWVPGPTADLEKLLQAQKSYRDDLAELGIDYSTRAIPLTREVVIASTDAAALEMAEEHLMINYRDEYGGGKWKHPFIGSQDSAPVDQLEALSRDRFLIGSPETIIDQINRFKAAFSMDHLICRLFFPGIPHAFIMDEIRLLAEEVLPVFR